MTFRPWHHAVVLAWLLIGLCVGCEPRAGTGHERYVPVPEKARATITVALEMWQRGEPVGEVPGTKPLVVVVDSFRREGQTLEQFEVLGEVPGLTQRTYLVKLTFANPAAEEKVRFAVLGIDPLWVY
ncbi:MAG: hypothetical protein IAG10_06530, partial [Planctomycetaceae bacterium]|nr:hypothetical protein [Planctomycetaceae bacterium]